MTGVEKETETSGPLQMGRSSRHTSSAVRRSVANSVYRTPKEGIEIVLILAVSVLEHVLALLEPGELR